MNQSPEQQMQNPAFAMQQEQIDMQIAGMEQAAEIERRQQLLAMAQIALRFQVSNPKS